VLCNTCSDSHWCVSVLCVIKLYELNADPYPPPPKHHPLLNCLATEEGWGVVKVDVAMNPVYSLSKVMLAIRNSFERLWTPKLCAALVRRCCEHEQRFYAEDSKVFGIGGLDEDVRCCVSSCPINPVLHVSGARGDSARSKVTRKCRGECGLAFHHPCFFHGRFQDEDEEAAAWPEGKMWCECGCPLSVIDSDGSESSDEMETLSPEAAAADNCQRLAADIGKKRAEYMAQIQRLVSAEAAAASVSKHHAGGAAKSLNGRS